MAIRDLMTWEPRKERWRKMFKGRVITVSCRQLGVPATKEASYQAANAWWRAKRAELDAAQPVDPLAPEAISIRRSMVDYLILDNPDDPNRRRLEQEIRALQSGAGVNTPQGVLLDPTSAMPVAEKIEWLDRIAALDKHFEWTGKTQPLEDRTVGALAERYSAFERSRYEDGHIKIGTWAQERGCLFTFRDWVGASQDAASITSEKYECYWAHLSKSHHSIDSRKRHLRIARQFCGWLAEMGLIPLPSNLASRRYRFKGESKPIATMSVEQVTTLLDHATGQLKLHMMLMLNCGFTQVDITDLLQSEVDWTKGRITRRRSKATSGGYSKAPVVTWQLWAQTFDLLQRHREPSGERVLLTEDKTPWTTRRAKGDAGFTKTDNIMSAFRRLLDKVEKSRPGEQFGSLSELRATASTMLDHHPTYGRYAQHFLGHSPRSVAQSNYVTPSQPLFDKAVTWLGKQFGF
jgi:integrase